jgi:hypothetical protein
MKNIVNNKFKPYCFLLIILLIQGCGTTKILLQDRKSNAEIYINGELKGKNHVEIQRTGIPKKIKIEAKSQNITIGEITVRREFKFSTFLIGYVTYGVGLFTAWKFPNEIYVPVTDNNLNNHKSLWDNPPESVWK